MRRAYTEGGDGAVATLVGSVRTPGGVVGMVGESITVVGGSVGDTQSLKGGIVSASEPAVFTPERTESGDRWAVSEPDGWPVAVADDSHRTVVGYSRETPAGRDDPEHCDRTAVVANPADE